MEILCENLLCKSHQIVSKLGRLKINLMFLNCDLIQHFSIVVLVFVLVSIALCLIELLNIEGLPVPSAQHTE